MTANTIILILELIGTVAFALSGAFVAMERQLDYFGIVVLAVTTAVGGGILRDLILGNTRLRPSAPPSMWWWPFSPRR